MPFFFFFFSQNAAQNVWYLPQPAADRGSVPGKGPAAAGQGFQPVPCRVRDCRRGPAHPTEQTTSRWPGTKGKDSANALFEWVSLMGKNCRYLILLFEPTTKADSRKWKSELCTVLKARNQDFPSVVLYCAHM